MEKLKPCPFCGGKADVWRTNYHVYIQCENFCMDDRFEHLVQVSGDTEEQALEAWNRRANDEHCNGNKNL